MEKNEDIKNYSWDYEDVKTFEAEITDTSLTYNLYVNIRHAFSFEWRNVWVDIETIFPDGKTFHKRVNLPLSQPDGQWFGHCLGDNCDIQVSIQNNAYFPQPGKYIFKLKQDMRVNPLNHVKSVGMRIEKNVAQ
jgi:gliding motility-associated lipoprotein GldH